MILRYWLSLSWLQLAITIIEYSWLSLSSTQMVDFCSPMWASCIAVHCHVSIYYSYCTSFYYVHSVATQLYTEGSNVIIITLVMVGRAEPIMLLIIDLFPYMWSTTVQHKNLPWENGYKLSTIHQNSLLQDLASLAKENCREMLAIPQNFTNQNL